jgi:KDO2-lipid IV(A) lauroyltransferase
MSLPPPVRRWRRRGFYVLVRVFTGLLRRLPRGLAEALLRGLAGVAWAALSRERRVARRQIERAFPELDAERCDGFARSSLRRLGQNLLDMLRADVPVNVSDVDRRRLSECLRDGPVVVLMAHAGAWELVGPVLVELTGRFGALTADPHNVQIGAWLRREREARGIRCFDRDREVASAARWLARGGCLAILADHRPRGPSVWSPWFGELVPTTTGPARLASMAGATILPVGIRRAKEGHWIGCGEAFAATGDASADAARCNRALEDLILRSPEEWTWFHDRYV